MEFHTHMTIFSLSLRPISVFSLSGFPLWSWADIMDSTLCLHSLVPTFRHWIFLKLFLKNSDFLFIFKARLTKHVQPTYAWYSLLNILFVFISRIQPSGRFHEGCFWNVNVIDLILQLILFLLAQCLWEHENGAFFLLMERSMVSIFLFSTYKEPTNF